VKINLNKFFVGIVLACSLQAQQDPVADARKLALSGHREEAKALLTKRLADVPGDTDARTLYGSILSWDGDNAGARRELEQVLKVSPTNTDAMQSMANVELNTNHPDKAQDLLVVLLKERPNDPDVLYSDARALIDLKRPREAAEVLEHVLQLDPGNKDAIRLRRGLGQNAVGTELWMEEYHEWFSDGIGNRAETQISLKQDTDLGALVGRFSNSEAFGLVSNQVDFDFYPGLRKGTYLYLNAGFSWDTKLYPQYRVGSDIYQTLGHGFEGTVGYRRLGFSTPVNIYTAALSKYQGDWLFTGRGYFTPNIAGTSESFQLIARRYFGENWVQFRFSHGSTPTEIITVTDTTILAATGYDVTTRKKFGRHWFFDSEFSYAREDRLGRPRVNHLLGNLGIVYRF
jgi:YaiO family outer membrane protein